MSKTVIQIPNTLGLHTRASAKLLDCAAKFQAKITITCNGKKADAKSILDLITLCAHKGSTLEIDAHGPDAEDAISSIEALIQNKFGELE